MSFPSLHASVGFTYACNLPRLVAKSPAAPAPASGATSRTARTSARMSAALTFTTPPRRRWDTGTLGRQAGGVNWVLPACCCNVKMSSPNCSVKRSSLNGDLHVEPEGTASAGAVEGAVGGGHLGIRQPPATQRLQQPRPMQFLPAQREGLH